MCAQWSSYFLNKLIKLILLPSYWSLLTVILLSTLTIEGWLEPTIEEVGQLSSLRGSSETDDLILKQSHDLILGV